jgi:hypothetical protein
MHRTLRAVVGASAAAAVAAVLVGCGTRDAVEATKNAEPTAAAPAVKSVPAAKSAPAVELAQVRYDALADAIQKQKGKVVVIDMWATW